MALDALVDSTQLDADLTSVADAIREKGGTSAELAFPTDFVSAIEAISGGGGGVTLLASGTRTTGSSITNISISVSYTGTAKFTMLVAENPPADTAQTVLAFFIPSFPVVGKTLSPNGYGGYVTKSASNVYAHSCINRNNVTFSVSSTTLTFGRPSPSSPWQPNTTYNWYIYGEK